jgi:hypothetical protein
LVAGRAVQAIRRLAAVAICFLVVGCYTMQPISGVTPPVGQVIALDINDAGRTALGGSMGPEIIQVEGRLISRDSSEYLVGVTAVRLLRGGEQVWRGENVRIKSEHVTSLYERRISKSRSLVLGAIATGAIALIATQALDVSGSRERTKSPSDTAEARRRP